MKKGGILRGDIRAMRSTSGVCCNSVASEGERIDLPRLRRNEKAALTTLPAGQEANTAYIPYFEFTRISNSTRRLRCRPLSVAFEAIGILSPYPTALIRKDWTPRLTR